MEVLRLIERLKEMIVNNLLTEYNMEEATKNVEEAEIKIKNNIIIVTWINGKINKYKIELTETLILIE